MDVNTILHASLANSFTAGASILLLGLLAHSVYSFFDKSSLKSYPGPLFARLSDLWLTWITARGRVNRVVAEAHKVYGPFVRIAPNHISISDPAALQAVYGHSNGAHKSDFYDVFASFGGRRAVFTTRTPAEHGRKRKLISNTFSQKTTLEFEPVVRQYIGGLVKQWDRMCAAATKGNGGIIGDMDWASDRGYAVFDALKWYTFMLFDITGDLVFRAPFGMTERGTDVARVAKRAEDAISKYSSAEVELEYDTIKAVDDVNARATLLVTTGMLPASWRGFVKQLPIPIFRRGNIAFKKLGSMAATAVAHRTQHEASRGDILSKYFEATDEQGNPMDSHEISIEALGLLVAGTDTTSNSMAAITFYLSQNPAVQAKLQQELDNALGAPRPDDDEEHPSLVPYDKIKNLPYLNDCVNEGLRLFSTVGLGLPREVGPEGLTVLGHTFAPGTVVSVPTFVVHRDPAVWGEDAEEFNPERWSTGDKAAMTKAFQPFSLGTRGCIGRNLASMELLMLISNVFYRYETAPAYPGSQMTIVDGLIRKPDSTIVSVKRRAC